jgi:hypothetical protein
LHRPAWQHVSIIVGGLLLAMVTGWIFGRPGLFAAIYLGCVALVQTRNLIRFERWLRLRSSTRPPSLSGLWGNVVDTANRLYRRKNFHKRRVLMLLR